MDKLIDAAIYYRDNVINLEYHLIVANRKKLNYIRINFYEEDFWHLIGLGAIKGYPQLKTNRSKLLTNI